MPPCPPHSLRLTLPQDGETPLMAAVANNNRFGVETLLAAGVDVSTLRTSQLYHVLTLFTAARTDNRRSDDAHVFGDPADLPSGLHGIGHGQAACEEGVRRRVRRHHQDAVRALVVAARPGALPATRPRVAVAVAEVIPRMKSPTSPITFSQLLSLLLLDEPTPIVADYAAPSTPLQRGAKRR